MSKKLYSPRLSDDVVRSLYQLGKRRRMPMTRLADELLRQGLAASHATATEPGSPPVGNPVIIRLPEAA
jgi:hypothetical protein